MEEFDGYPVRRGFAGADWYLEDCEAVAKESPQTFKVPSNAARKKAKVGWLIRLHFVIANAEINADPLNPRAERMWVEICDMRDESAMLGHLTNEPVFISSLEPGDVIEFSWKHAAQIDSP